MKYLSRIFLRYCELLSRFMKWLFGVLKRSSRRLTADTSKAAYTWGDEDEYSELAVSNIGASSSDIDTDIHAYVRQGYAKGMGSESGSESGGYRQEVYAKVRFDRYIGETDRTLRYI